MKKILHRIATAFALRLAATKALRREEQNIYQEALLKKKAANHGGAAKVEKTPVFKQEEVLAPMEF